MAAERCHCGREWVTAVKEEVVKPLEKQFQGLRLFLCKNGAGWNQSSALGDK